MDGSLRCSALFAPPRFLGLLRKQGAADMALGKHEGDLSHLDANELALHPAVMEALKGG